jgi:hypothetical protein
MKAAFDPRMNGSAMMAHNGAGAMKQGMSNAGLHKYFVAINENREVFAYFEGQWQRPMDIIELIHRGGNRCR